MGRPRKDGQPTQHGNRYTAGVVTRERVDKVVAFKPKVEVADALFADMEARQMTATQWLDMAVAKLLLEGDSELNEGQPQKVKELSPVLRDAIATSIQLKEAAISREKKAKRPDEEAIAKWQAEIEELETLL